MTRTRAPDPADFTDHDQSLPDPLPTSPWPTFTAWFDEARRRDILPNPNAMVLATVDDHACPDARVVLCKHIAPDPGYISFYTNYDSRKGTQLAANPHAAVVFHWDALQRQVRLAGPVVRSPGDESDAYFASRPWQSRIGAWASSQSQPLPSRRRLVEQVDAAMARFDIDPSDANPTIPRPPNWGGFRLWVERFELWVGSPTRLHDRAAWTRTLTPDAGTFRPGSWSATRLQP